MIGRRFHRLTVTGAAGGSGQRRRWICSCQCGGSTISREWSLLAGHSMYGSLEYLEWLRMKSRCYYPRNRAYQKYGGSGVKVCERWRESFIAFLEDMGPKPSPFHSIVRSGERGHFSPDNCRWVLNRARLRRSLLKSRDRSCNLPGGPAAV